MKREDAKSPSIRKIRSKGFYLSKTQTAVLFASPAIIFTFVLLLYPIITVFRNSMYDMRLYVQQPSKYIGFENFSHIFTKDPYFWTAFKNTLVFTGIAVPLELFVGFLLALLLNLKIRSRGIYRTLLLLPWVTPPVVAALMWAWLLNYNSGLVNYLLTNIGILSSPRLWLGEAQTALLSVIFIDLWRETPFFILVLLAGMQTVPIELYEAVKIDGGNFLAQIRYVMLPLIKHSILISLLIRTMSAFKIFDLIYVLTHGGPAGATEVLATYTYKTTFEYMKIGLGSAMSIFILLIVIILSIIYIRLLGKQDNA
ncbi:MAG: ABC transporter permease [Spirochaetae bacterium HGW-Spirochaetae-8]|jgi:ABC-type sugar transport system permease subunit|nr:MAG: ABC transporter permease [Spirochaetae bacterium HGW-Spirochaetae-8]